jgi:hypothetical protein
MKRLLDPTDLQFLRQSGASTDRISKLRVERRALYRLYLRTMASDFTRIDAALSAILVSSSVDRPELAALLAKSKVNFYWGLVLAEIVLLVHVCGIDEMPVIDVWTPIETVQEQLRQLTPAML